MTRAIMNITLLEKNELVNISILGLNPLWTDTEVNIEGYQHVVKGKTYQDFLNAPETFRYEERDWVI